MYIGCMDTMNRSTATSLRTANGVVYILDINGNDTGETWPDTPDGNAARRRATFGPMRVLTLD